MISYEDFIRKPEVAEEPPVPVTDEDIGVDAQGDPMEAAPTAEDGAEESVKIEELNVQKAVVESFATEKAELEVKIEDLTKKLEAAMADNAELRCKLAEQELGQHEIDKLKALCEEMKEQLANVGEILARNSEKPVSNQVSVLDRNEELDDRFDGETRDHILEVLTEARATAEADGRLRRAQLIEAVLAANEPCGLLAKNRAEIEKLFADNQHIINGQVINSLDNMGIRYKDGENYLLAKEIIKRNY